MTDIQNIDWNEAWKERRRFSTSSGRRSQLWNKRAPTFARNVGRSPYAASFIAIMNPKPDWTVFDMGCGPGTLATPLAPLVKEVTAADFSQAMLDILRTRMKKKGIDNIRTVNTSWQDDWKKAGIGMHDVVISSRSLAVDDLRNGIMKMEKYARKRVYISTMAGGGPVEPGILEAIGRPRHGFPDYIYNYNLLYQMGIHANVAFIEQKSRRTYANKSEALELLRLMLGEITAKEDAVLVSYLDRHLLCKGGRWMMDSVRTMKWAVLWWDKKHRQHR